jgi:hypothetical protein
MDYGKVLSRAWEITWRYKILWVLGFLASLGSGGGSSGNSGFRGSSTNGQFNGFNGFNIAPQITGLLVALACVVVIIGLALWVIGLMARGGLIAGVAQVEDTGRVTLGEAFHAGQRRFWTLFGIAILVALPIIVLVLIAVVAIIIAAGGVAGLMRGAEQGAQIGGAVLTALACALPFICGAIVLGIVLEQIRVYAERAAMLEGLGWLDAFRRGWQVLKQHIGPTIVFWVIFLVIGLVLVGIVVAGVVAAFAPFFIAFGRNGPPNWVFLPLCGAGLIGIVVAALIGSVIDTFTSATWTLAYRQFIMPAAPVPPVTPDAPVVVG